MLLPGIVWPGGSPENTGIIVGVVAAAYLAALWLAAILWTLRDVRSRSRDPITQLIAALLVIILSLPGWLLYLVLRPPLTLSDAYGRQLDEEAILQGLAEQFICPRCTANVRDDYVVCPHCTTWLREPCVSCERALMFSWRVCPWCAKARTPKTVAMETLTTTPTRETISAEGRSGTLPDHEANRDADRNAAAEERDSLFTRPTASAESSSSGSAQLTS